MSHFVCLKFNLVKFVFFFFRQQVFGLCFLKRFHKTILTKYKRIQEKIVEFVRYLDRTVFFFLHKTHFKMTTPKIFALPDSLSQNKLKVLRERILKQKQKEAGLNDSQALNQSVDKLGSLLFVVI